jgi:hypothetical protein
MYEYSVGDLIFLKNEITYLARKYTYLEDGVKLFMSFVNIDSNDLFIAVAKEVEFSPNSIKLLNLRTGEIIEAYPHIFIKIQ